MNYRILNCDVLDGLAQLDAESVQCCVTSPPYWGLRDYKCTGQIGLEKTPQGYVERMVGVFREVWRVLAKDGTLWLNLGDTYATFKGACKNHGGGANSMGIHLKASEAIPVNRASPNRMMQKGTDHLKPKDLIGIPWHVAFALQQDGWYLRSDIIWSKPNPMPESVTDRPTRSHEYIFLLTKSVRYYYDADAIKEPCTDSTKQRLKTGWNGNRDRGHPSKQQNNFHKYMGTKKALEKAEIGRNKRDVWIVPTMSFPGAHFATFPSRLIEPCILAGSRPGDTVLDPFCGSGTTLLVALQHGRKGIGIELNPDYVEMAHRRIAGDLPLLAAGNV